MGRRESSDRWLRAFAQRRGAWGLVSESERSLGRQPETKDIARDATPKQQRLPIYLTPPPSTPPQFFFPIPLARLEPPVCPGAGAAAPDVNLVPVGRTRASFGALAHSPTLRSFRRWSEGSARLEPSCSIHRRGGREGAEKERGGARGGRETPPAHHQVALSSDNKLNFKKRKKERKRKGKNFPKLLETFGRAVRRAGQGVWVAQKSPCYRD